MIVATTISFGNRNSLLISLLLISSSLHFFCISPLLAKSSPHPISDVQVRSNKLQCYADIDRFSPFSTLYINLPKLPFWDRNLFNFEGVNL
ncbi:unnamed protein product [Lathyrus oleraceus]